MSAITIRPEQAGDVEAIRELTEAAFRNAPHSDGSEPGIVDALRRHDGRIAPVLDELDLPRRTLNEKMARLGLSRTGEGVGEA